MNGLLVIGMMVLWLASVVGGWLVWQLLRQNGRLLLRVDELENRLDELEFGEHDEVSDPKSEVGSQKSAEEQSLVTSAATNGDGHTNRFGNRSLTRSRIRRDGLKAGTPAPDFRLPRLDGHGELALSELRSKRVLLVFSDPHCGPCNALAPELEKFHREQTKCEEGRVTPCAPLRGDFSQNGAHGVTRPTMETSVVMISRGEPKENRAKAKEHGLTFPVVLQQQWEISRRYAMFATPVAYLVDESGVIAHDVAVGTDAIQDLMARTMRLRDEMQAAV